MLADVPGSFFGNRRVFYSQGIRISQGSGGGRKPPRSGARQASRFCGGSRAGGIDPQRHGYALSQSRSARRPTWIKCEIYSSGIPRLLSFGRTPAWDEWFGPLSITPRRLSAILKDPAFNHVYFDISWDEVAKYFVASPATTKVAADLINRYPDRFLFGTDEVAPADQQQYLKIYYQYGPLWNLLDKTASDKLRKENYERHLRPGKTQRKSLGEQLIRLGSVSQ